MSAVSMRLRPADTNPSSSRNPVVSSTVQPNTLPPQSQGGDFQIRISQVSFFHSATSSSFCVGQILSDNRDLRNRMNLRSSRAPVAGSLRMNVLGFFGVTGVEVQPAFEFTPVAH